MLSAHAQSPRENECCAVLGRWPSDGEPAFPRISPPITQAGRWQFRELVAVEIIYAQFTLRLSSGDGRLARHGNCRCPKTKRAGPREVTRGHYNLKV